MGIQKYTHPAMGTTIVLILPTQHFLKDIDNVFSFFDTQEQKFSRFQQDSLLSKLNTEKTIQGDKDFFEVMKLAHSYYTLTQGIFNPLLSAKSLGYTKDFNTEKDKQNLNTPLLQQPKETHHNYNFDEVFFNEDIYEIKLQKDQEIDLGGIVKGWTVDKAAELLKKTYDSFLINAGGDIYAYGEQEENIQWCVGLEGEKKTFLLKNQAIATSGKIKRKWQDQTGKFHHHILSNLTQESSKTDYGTISVIGDSCTQCDVFATTAFALEEKGEEFLRQQNLNYYISNT